MSCKSCFHYQACFGTAKVFDVKARGLCDCFLAKSKVIVLKCSIGDTVYHLHQYKNDYIVSEGTIDDMYCTHDGHIFVRIKQQTMYKRGELGVKFFLSREEAETARKALLEGGERDG